MASPDVIAIEVIYALPHQLFQRHLQLPTGATVKEAILQSGLLQHHPEIVLKDHKVGIYGRIVPLETPLKTGDRVEVYRPLLIDPKQARRNRAALKRTSK